MNVGVVGLGKMGILHASIVNAIDGARVTAVCEKDFFLASAAKALLPKTVAVYRDIRAMLEKEKLEAVFITTPISSHIPILDDLLRIDRDLSVFVEKPLASSYEEAMKACEIVQSSRGVHMVGFQKRFSPVFRKARELIEQNIIGDPIFFRSYCFSSDVLRRGQSWRFRKGAGGVLLDSAPHLVDLLLWFFGEPQSITAVKRSVHSLEVEDYVHAVMSYESGLRGHMDACWSTPNFRLPEFSIEIHAEKGMLAANDDFVKVAPYRESGQMARGQVYHKQSFDQTIPFLLAEQEYSKEDVAFIDSVRTHATSETNFVQAAKVNALIGRIFECAN